MRKTNFFVFITFFINLIFINIANPYIGLAENKVDTIQSITTEEWQYLHNLPTLNVAFIDESAPLTYLDNNNHPKGITITIMDEIAQKLDLKVKYKSYNSIEEMFDDEIDIVLNSTPYYLQDTELYVTDPYLATELFLVYNNEQNLKKLEQKKIGIISGGTIPQNIPVNNIHFYDTRRQVLQAINKGEIDYAYANAHSVAFYMFQDNYDNVHYTPTNKPDREYSLATTAENAQLLPILDKALYDIDEGRMNSIILEILSDAKQPFTFKNFIQKYYISLFSIITLVIGYFIYVNQKLKNVIVLNNEKEQQIRHLSYYDALTNIYNRRFAEEEFSKIDEAQCYPVSIIIGDINYLKNVNDNFGHKHGDQLLINTANILKTSCRSDDVVARYGGDEFIIILKNVSNQDVEKIINRIRKKSLQQNHLPYPISIALGYSFKKYKEQPIEEVVTEADQLMYINKKEMKEE